MMGDYVKRSDTLQAVGDIHPLDYNGQGIVERIKAIPAADVVEVRHGLWHKYSKGSGSLNGVIILSDAFQCTVCKESFWNKSNYCPNCGAKMDGGQDE